VVEHAWGHGENTDASVLLRPIYPPLSSTLETMAALLENHTAGYANPTSLPSFAQSLHLDRAYKLISRPFAARVGGNHHFTLEADTPENQRLLQRIPDAAPYLTFRESFDLRPFGEIELWKQGIVECYG
jgi:hypothetical protein